MTKYTDTTATHRRNTSDSGMASGGGTMRTPITSAAQANQLGSAVPRRLAKPTAMTVSGKMKLLAL